MHTNGEGLDEEGDDEEENDDDDDDDDDDEAIVARGFALIIFRWVSASVDALVVKDLVFPSFLSLFIAFSSI